MIREELKFVPTRRRIVTRYERGEIFLGINRGVAIERTAADDVSAARFEKVPGIDIVDF